jgi:hypothetical protein
MTFGLYAVPIACFRLIHRRQLQARISSQLMCGCWWEKWLDPKFWQEPTTA